MEAEILLQKVLSAGKAEDVFSIRYYKKEYADMVKQLHPDVCHLPLSGEAMTKLNLHRSDMNKYNEGEDDAGSFVFKSDNEVVFTGDKDLLKRSYSNYQLLMNRSDAAANHFKKYLPQSMSLTSGGLIIKSQHRMLPLTHLTLPHEHSDWILSRIYELISWLHQVGYCHLGINPESVFIVPETHGIVCVSFYHFTPINTKPDSLSGRYLTWYPAIIFTQKNAIEYIDISLAQRTALYIMGDKSGNGVSLKKSVNPRLIDFLIQPHYNSYQTYGQFRALLVQLFGKPFFHQLNI